MSFREKVRRSIFIILTIAILGFVTEASSESEIKLIPKSKSPIILKTEVHIF